MSPVAELWVGYRAANEPPGTAGNVVQKIPDDVFSAIEDGKYEGDLRVRLFWVSGRVVGVGVEILHRKWDSTAESVDPRVVSHKADALKKKVADLFATWGVREEPKVFLTVDVV